jgi:hypothetical protein
MLAAMARHGVHAVGLVTWDNVHGEEDLELLRLWLEAGHELGNHSRSHLDYSRTEPEAYIADVEACRVELAAFLEPYGTKPRFFRFPYLREGDTPAKLGAMRDYLAASGQRNLPPTIDDQDWSFEVPWVEAHRAGDTRGLERIGEDYRAAMRLMVRHHERTGDELFDRETPQILLTHATEVSGAQWDALFTWLEESGHRFVDADTVLADPAFAVEHEYVGPLGLGLWDRLLFERRVDEAKDAIRGVLDAQMAAWNAGDVEGFCAHYAEDMVYISTGGITRSREALAARYRERYPGKEGMGELTLEALEWSPAAGVEVSLLGDARPSRVHGMTLIARWTLRYPDRDPLTGLTMLAFRRGPTGWEIARDASM